MRSLDAPPVDAISGWFGADLSGSTSMMAAAVRHR